MFTPRLALGAWGTTGADGTFTVPGATLAFVRTLGAWTTQAMAEVYDATGDSFGGRFHGLGVDVATSAAAFDFGGGVKYWRTPTTTEWGYSAYASREFAHNLRVVAQLTRAVTDPILASPASFGASLGISWRIVTGRNGPAPIAAVGAATANGRRVRFTIISESATSAAVTGSFSEWTPVPMAKKGKAFTVEVTVPHGTYQFGFLLNGTDWYVPAAAGGLIDDGFGRKNATLVIERE